MATCRPNLFQALLRKICYNGAMPIKSFLIMALICAIQTVFFSQALFADQTLLAVFWGFLLVRNLYRVYLVDRFSRFLSNPKK